MASWKPQSAYHGRLCVFETGLVVQNFAGHADFQSTLTRSLINHSQARLEDHSSAAAVLVGTIAFGLPVVLLSYNTSLTAVVLALIPIAFALLWRRGEPPVLLFALAAQWLQVSTAVFHANILDIPIESLVRSARASEAVIYSLIGLLVLTLGMRAGIGKQRRSGEFYQRRAKSANRWSLQRVWRAYLVALAVSFSLKGLTSVFPPITQIFLAILNVKWVIFFLFAFLIIYRRKGYGLLLMATSIEVVIGFTGFFSGFRQVFFVLILAYISARPTIRGKDAFVLTGLFALLIGLILFWTAVKPEYRKYVSGGTGEQIIKESFESRLAWMIDAVHDFRTEDIAAAADEMARRVAYVTFFSYTLDRVPRHVPYENGAIWTGALVHILTPRIVFHDKPRLVSDTVKTDQYTGLRLAHMAGKTSISTGYMAESYIDFGFPYMYIPIFLVGVLWGLIYRFFTNRSSDYPVHAAAAVTVLLSTAIFEINATKLLGGVVMGFIVMALALRYGLPVLRPLLLRPSPD